MYRSLGGDDARLQEIEETHERKRGRRNWQADSDNSIDLNEVLEMDSEETDEESAPPVLVRENHMTYLGHDTAITAL